WTAILAASFLGERMTVWKILAIVLGVVGVIVIVRPATGDINPGQLIALGAAVGFGISVGGRILALALRLDMALRLRLGLDRRDRVLRHIFPLLHCAGGASC